MARLMYKDEATGRRKEKSKTGSSSSEAKRFLRELETEFSSRGQVAVESHETTFEALVEHCKQTRLLGHNASG